MQSEVGKVTDIPTKQVWAETASTIPLASVYRMDIPRKGTILYWCRSIGTNNFYVASLSGAPASLNSERAKFDREKKVCSLKAPSSRIKTFGHVSHRHSLLVMDLGRIGPIAVINGDKACLKRGKHLSNSPPAMS